MKNIVELPKAISKSIIEEVDSSLNTLFPKLFYEINIKEELIEIVIPEIDNIIKDLSKLVKIVARTPLKDIEVYTIGFPLIKRACRLSYDKRKDSIKSICKYEEFPKIRGRYSTPNSSISRSRPYRILT